MFVDMAEFNYLELELNGQHHVQQTDIEMGAT